MGIGEISANKQGEKLERGSLKKNPVWKKVFFFKGRKSEKEVEKK